MTDRMFEAVSITRDESGNVALNVGLDLAGSRTYTTFRRPLRESGAQWEALSPPAQTLVRTAMVEGVEAVRVESYRVVAIRAVLFDFIAIAAAIQTGLAQAGLVEPDNIHISSWPLKPSRRELPENRDGWEVWPSQGPEPFAITKQVFFGPMFQPYTPFRNQVDYGGGQGVVITWPVVINADDLAEIMKDPDLTSAERSARLRALYGQWAQSARPSGLPPLIITTRDGATAAVLRIIVTLVRPEMFDPTGADKFVCLVENLKTDPWFSRQIQVFARACDLPLGNVVAELGLPPGDPSA